MLLYSESPKIFMVDYSEHFLKGMELEILADLIHNGALRHLDYISIDFHPWFGQAHKSFRY